MSDVVPGFAQALAARYRIERELGAGDAADARTPDQPAGRRFRPMASEALPGGDLIAQGLRDLEQGIETIESLLVPLGAPALRALGLQVPDPYADAELRLYRLLAARYGAGAHAKYNALIRRLVSFQRAAACARTD